ncbi:hypothetical protein D3C81_2321970 [compost metagenome]
MKQLGDRLGFQGQSSGNGGLLILWPEADGVCLALSEDLLKVQWLDDLRWRQLAEVNDR